MEIELRHALRSHHLGPYLYDRPIRDRLAHGRHIWVHIWVGQYAMGWHGREVRGSAARTPATALPFCP